MNAKTSRSKTKTPATRAAAKPASALTTARKPSKGTTTSIPARKPVAKRPNKASVEVQAATAPLAVRDSKQARLIGLLRDVPGATIEQMMFLTGWQAHTVRGTISGVLRKKLGLNVACEAAPDSETRVYRILGSGAA